jgi:hypothetical protein
VRLASAESIVLARCSVLAQARVAGRELPNTYATDAARPSATGSSGRARTSTQRTAGEGLVVVTDAVTIRDSAVKHVMIGSDWSVIIP